MELYACFYAFSGCHDRSSPLFLSILMKIKCKQFSFFGLPSSTRANCFFIVDFPTRRNFRCELFLTNKRSSPLSPLFPLTEEYLLLVLSAHKSTRSLSIYSWPQAKCQTVKFKEFPFCLASVTINSCVCLPFAAVRKLLFRFFRPLQQRISDNFSLPKRAQLSTAGKLNI